MNTKICRGIPHFGTLPELLLLQSVAPVKIQFSRLIPRLDSSHHGIRFYSVCIVPLLHILNHQISEIDEQNLIWYRRLARYNC